MHLLDHYSEDVLSRSICLQVLCLNLGENGTISVDVSKAQAVLGEERDSYSIPEYKQAMREKEAAEAEVEILQAEKIEIEAVFASVGDQIEAGQDEIEEQKATLEEINTQLAEAEKRVQSKTSDMDKIIAAGKPVEKEIKEIRSQVSKIPQIFGGEPMVKIPENVFEKNDFQISRGWYI